jgi:predicted GNAT family acetyltransferase
LSDKLDVTVTDNAQQHRYEAVVDGRPAGFAAYRLRPGFVVFTHTQVDAQFEGGGVGSALARAALDDVRAKGQQVVPLCPFVAAYIERHPDYQDLVETG